MERKEEELAVKFWRSLNEIVLSSRIVIDRPKGSRHPKYPMLVFPLDYGYLEGTKSTDGAEIDVWRGSENSNTVSSVVCTVDNVKRDSEIKILIGCTIEETQTILDCYNSSDHMSALLINRQ